MSGRPPESFPWEPLRRLHDDDTILALAARSGIARRSLHRYAAANQIPWYSADRIACALDLHPTNIWTDWERL